MIINFLEETKSDLIAIDKVPEDIEAIFSNDNGFISTWDDFVKVADFEYDNDYVGEPGIVEDLTILFSDNSWLCRSCTIFTEFWEYTRIPVPLFYKSLDNSEQLKL